jgi:hypothetical protein
MTFSPLGLDDPAGVFERRSRVALEPGPQYGTGGDGFVRLSFATTNHPGPGLTTDAGRCLRLRSREARHGSTLALPLRGCLGLGAAFHGGGAVAPEPAS